MKKIKRLLAIAGIVLLAAMYLVTLICALFDASRGMIMFKASAMCTILVPILLWGYMVIYRLAKGKNEQELEEVLQHIESEETESQKNEPEKNEPEKNESQKNESQKNESKKQQLQKQS